MAMDAHSPLLEPAEARALIADGGAVVLCATGGGAATTVTEGIPGAQLAVVETEFSDPTSPLPHTAPADIQAVFERHGISDDTHVVIYDAAETFWAPRVWWLALASGLTRVHVLNGGLRAWQAAGFPIAPLDSALPERGHITAPSRELFDVPAPGRLVVDARARARFAGRVPEPRPGLRRGHIPGSINVPYANVLTPDQRLRPAAELRGLLPEPQPLLFTCGSGVTACILALAAVVAGHTDIKVYDGSWSEWGAVESGQDVEVSNG